jgi:hypothetical protein
MAVGKNMLQNYHHTFTKIGLSNAELWIYQLLGCQGSTQTHILIRKQLAYNQESFFRVSLIESVVWDLTKNDRKACLLLSDSVTKT